MVEGKSSSVWSADEDAELARLQASPFLSPGSCWWFSFFSPPPKRWSTTAVGLFGVQGSVVVVVFLIHFF